MALKIWRACLEVLAGDPGCPCTRRRTGACLLGWLSSSTEREASAGTHMEHGGRKGAPTLRARSGESLLAIKGVTNVAAHPAFQIDLFNF